MEIKDAVSLVSSITGGIKDVKDACSLIPVGLFSFTPNINVKVRELQNKINSLEGMINDGFPKLKKLIILYSEIKTDVSIARALSDKQAEIIRLAPTVVHYSTVTQIVHFQNSLSSIELKLNELPCLDQAEAGAIISKLERISKYIRDIQNLTSRGREQVENNVTQIAQYFSDISEEYREIESKLSALLNNKILKDLENFNN
jgi:hypothetical protein